MSSLLTRLGQSLFPTTLRRARGALQPIGAAAINPLFPLYMLDATRGMANHRHKKILKLAKGYRGRAKSCYTVAIQRVTKARQYAYRDRKVKKRDIRKLWIQRINAGTRMYGLPYSFFINSMLRANIQLNRKVLADMAVTEPLSFKSVVVVAKELGLKDHSENQRLKKARDDEEKAQKKLFMEKMSRSKIGKQDKNRGLASSSSSSSSSMLL